MDYCPPRYWTSDLGVTTINLIYFTVFTGVESFLPGTSNLGVTITNLIYFTIFTGIESVPPGMSDLEVMIDIKLLKCYAAWRGREIWGSVVPQGRREYATWWHSMIHCTKDSGCTQCHGDYGHWAPTLIRRVCLAAGSNHGGSAWLTTPTILLVDCGDGGTCFKNGPCAERTRVHASWGSQNHISVLLWQARTPRPTRNAVDMVCVCIADSFVKWIGWSAHFNVDPIPLEEGWHLAAVAQERHRQCSRIQDVPNQPAHPVRETSSGSSLQLVGRAPPMPENQEGAATLAEPPQPSLGRLHHCPQRLRQLRNEGGGGSSPSSPECPGRIDSDGQSTLNESDGDHRHRRCWRQERRLAPAWLNLPVFRSMDANTDVTY